MREYPKHKKASLNLANGDGLFVEAADSHSERTIGFLAKTMLLGKSYRYSDRILVAASNEPALARNETGADCVLGKPENADTLAILGMRLASVMALRAATHGGLPVHGALVVAGETGVIIAGQSGVGKTTACRRLPEQWEVLSDDCALAVRCGYSEYRAHPWPTWSSFMFGGPGGSWDVKRHVPLKGIFLLDREREASPRLMKTSEAVCALAASAEQIAATIFRNMDRAHAVLTRMAVFENICRLAGEIPCWRLPRHGAFWKTIRQCIENT